MESIVPDGYVCPPLNSVTHPKTDTSRTWCGPSAISAITGWSVDEAARWLWQRRGKKGTPKGVRGTYPSEVCACLGAAGFGTLRIRTRRLGHDDRPTLAEWMRKRGPELRKATVLLSVGHHWVVVRGRKFVDSHTLEPVSIRKAPHRRSRVKYAFVVVKPKHQRVKRYAPQRVVT